jgi:hypothetical protein
MLLLRIILVLSLISLAVSGAMYLYTRDRRYLRFIGQTVKYVVFICSVLALPWSGSW